MDQTTETTANVVQLPLRPLRHDRPGALRRVHVAFILTTCTDVPPDAVREAVRNILLEAGASGGAIGSVTVAPVPSSPRPRPRRGGAA